MGVLPPPPHRRRRPLHSGRRLLLRLARRLLLLLRAGSAGCFLHALLRRDASGGADVDALPAARLWTIAAEVARLEQKAASLGRVVDEQREGIKILNAEVARRK